MNQASVQGQSPVPPLPTNSHYFMQNLGGQGQGSLPTSPYGHPNGVAVSQGIGLGRDQAAMGSLPSIRSWEAQDGGQINPMFKVVSERFFVNW
jgi:hypothetical protein